MISEPYSWFLKYFINFGSTLNILLFNILLGISTFHPLSIDETEPNVLTGIVYIIFNYLKHHINYLYIIIKMMKIKLYHKSIKQNDYLVDSRIKQLLSQANQIFFLC